jgi:hypothetical protein
MRNILAKCGRSRDSGLRPTQQWIEWFRNSSAMAKEWAI